MVIGEALFILQLITQAPDVKVSDVSVFDDFKKNTKDTSSVVLPVGKVSGNKPGNDDKTGKTKDAYSFFTGKYYFGNNGLGIGGYGLSGRILTKAPYADISAVPYFELENVRDDNNMGSIEQSAKAGAALSIKSKGLAIEPSAELSRNDYRNLDTLTSSENRIIPIQNGISWINSQDIQTSDETREDVGKFLGLGTAILGKKNKTSIQFGSNNHNSNSKIITLDDFMESYRDSTYTDQGLVVVTNTDLITRVLTNNETDSKNKVQENFWRFFYQHQLKNWELGAGAILQNHIVENDLRNRTYITTDANGRTIVTVYGNNSTYVDTIPVSMHSESVQTSRYHSRAQVNTDLLSFLIGLSKGKVNDRLYFDKAFFNSKEWALKNQLSYNIGNFTNALNAQVNNSSFGFGTVLACEQLPLKFAEELTGYLKEKEELSRDVSKNDKQKELIQGYRALELADKLYGPYASVDFEKVGGRQGYWKFNGELGYSALGEWKARGGIILVRDHKKFYLGGGNKTVDGNIFYERQNIEGDRNAWKLGAEASFRFSD